MKRLSLPLVALLLVGALLLLGAFDCDGDSSDNGNGQTASPPPTTVTLKEGTTLAPPGSSFLTEFTVNETGTLVATLIWGGQPAGLGVTLYNLGQGAVGLTTHGSPLTHTVTVTDSLLASSSTWRLQVAINPGPAVTVSYVVKFTPN